MASARNYRLTPKAEADMDAIWLYSSEQWSADQADTYIRTFLDTFSDLALGNRHGLPVVEMPGYRRILVGSHVIYYCDHPTHVEVIRVLHQSMDPNRHF